MRDIAHEQTDGIIRELEKKLAKEYSQAEKELQAKLDDYLKRYEAKDKKWQKWVADGTKTAEEYKQWKTGQVMTGKRWEAMRDSMAAELHNVNVTAREIVSGEKPTVYVINHDYTTYKIEQQTSVDTSYLLYNKDTTNRIIAKEAKILPDPGKNMKARIAAGKDIAWQKGQIQSVTTQAILQGESIPNMAKRIASTMGETNHKSTIRYARTAITSAENGGRIHAMERAQSYGIKLQKTWMATLDGRTRDSHVDLDGQSVDVEEPFLSDHGYIMFPGDPFAHPAEIWNCRCTMITQVEGFENDMSDLSWRNTDNLEEESYEDWKSNHRASSRSITYQEDVGEAIRRQYVAEYRRG